MFGFFRKSARRLAMKEAKPLIDGGAVLIDVRSPEEYRSGHIPGAVSVPLERIGGIRALYPDRETALLTYCHSGVRSRRACKTLSGLGFRNVFDLGGILSWKGELIKGISPSWRSQTERKTADRCGGGKREKNENSLYRRGCGRRFCGGAPSKAR